MDLDANISAILRLLLVLAPSLAQLSIMLAGLALMFQAKALCKRLFAFGVFLAIVASVGPYLSP